MERATSTSVKITDLEKVGQQESLDSISGSLKSISVKKTIPNKVVPDLSEANLALQQRASTWLSWQCRMVSGVVSGAVFLADGGDNLGLHLARWPGADTGGNLLAEVAASSQASLKSTVLPSQTYGSNSGQTYDFLACPLLIEEKPVAIVSLMISPRSKPQRHAVLQLLEWGLQWLETLIRQEVELLRENGAMTLQLLSSVLAHKDSKTAAIETVNRLADDLSCERVSIGFSSTLSTRLVALSNVSHFEGDRQLIREIEATMDEAVDQASSIVYPFTTEPSLLVVQAHANLVRQRGKAFVCSVPLKGNEGYIGALTFERDPDNPFTRANIMHCEAIAKLLGPVFELMLQEERSLLAKGSSVFQLSLGRIFGKGFLKLKVAVLSTLLILFAASGVKGEYQIKASATLQGDIRQLLVAPQDGYVETGKVRAGDLVVKGQLLASLDDRVHQLERQKWQSERNKLQKQYQQAFSEHDRIQLGILQAQLDQADAEIKLVADQIARMSLHSPFDGIVVSGDLSQAQGAPVELGQVLFEVTPLNNYRVILEVDEHDIALLRSGQAGRLVMTAMPQTTYNLTLDKVIPVAISSDGYNYFRVEASLDKPSSMLRPGMGGVAKVTIEQRSILWIWTHELIDRLRLWGWSIGVAG